MAAPTPGGPSPLLPLAYLTAAAAAFATAAIATVWLAPELGAHYYHPRLLALTHVVTLGWITLAIMGASYQLAPVVLERPIWSERLARWQLAILTVSVIGMVAHFYLGTWPELATAAGLLGVGVALHLVNIGVSLHGFQRWTFTTRLIALGYAGLALTTGFGLALAANHSWPFLPGQHFPMLHAHMHLALLGWVAPMILGVSARVYPMFLIGPAPRRWAIVVQLWGLALGVPAIVVGLLGVRGLLPLGSVVVAAAAASHVAWVLEMAHGRKRPRLDWGLRFTLAATAFLLPAIVLGLALAFDLLSGPRVAFAYAITVLGGWVSLTIAGMMLKIVPFLVWYRVYSPRAGRERVPTLAEISSPQLEGAACALLTTGVVLLAITTWLGDAAFIRGAGVLSALGALTFVGALARILRHLQPRADGWAPRSRVPGAASERMT